MSYLDWHVGMKVVCVKEDAWQHYTGPKAPVVVNPTREEICTIGAIDSFKDEVFIALQEYGHTTFYDAAHFRPVQKRTTDISALKALLLNPFVKIGEDA